MKLFKITAVLMALSAALLAGCRNRPDTTMPSTRPSTVATTAPRQTIPSTAPSNTPTTAPMPSVTIPSGTDTTPATNGTDGILNPSEHPMDKGRGTPRY